MSAVTFYLWHDWKPEAGSAPAASFRTQHEAEQAGVAYVCSFGRDGTWEAMVTSVAAVAEIDAVTMQSFVRAVAGFYWVGMPGDWWKATPQTCPTCPNEP